MARGAHHHDTTEFEIARPNEKVLGQSISEWTEDWWSWVLQGPAKGNPLFDETGQDADVENDGPVFFVAGAQTEGVVREFTVPDDTPLLVPILNNFSSQFDTDPEPQKAAHQQGTRELEEFGNRPVPGNRRRSGETPAVLFPEPSLFSPGPLDEESLGASFYGDQPVDDAYPARSAGYWVLIEDLSPGEHTLRFGGTSKYGSVEVTDYILVV